MLNLFFSYSHRDEEYRNELEVHLAMLKRQGIIEAWHDRRIGAGKDIHKEISEHLETAEITLLLVSPYFLASDYCYDVEMKRALERHAQGKARVIPVILHPCDWQNAPFGHLRATPRDGKPISKYTNIHEAFLAVVEDIRLAAKDLSAGKPKIAAHKAQENISHPAPVTDVRSSNLRVKRPFSDRDRDRFIEEAFSYIGKFFDNSLAELEKRQDGIECNFRQVSQDCFTAAVYIDGQKRSSCRVWRGSNIIGDIAYSSSDSSRGNSFNDSLTIVDDGYTLLLRPLGLSHLGTQDNRSLTKQGAAEYFWSILIRPLQY
jgi:hypothetical protein